MSFDFGSIWKKGPSDPADEANNPFSSIFTSSAPESPAAVQGIPPDPGGLTMADTQPSTSGALDFLKPVGDALGSAASSIGNWASSRVSSDQQASQDQNIQKMYDAPLTGGILRMFDPVIQTLKDPRAYLFPKNAAEQQTATQNAEGLFGLVGAGAVPPGIPEGALGARAADTAAESGSLIGARELRPIGSLAGPEERLALPAPKPTLASGENAGEPLFRTAMPMDGAVAAPSPRGQFWNGLSDARQVEPPIEGDFRELPAETAPTAPVTAPLSLDDLFRQKVADAQARMTQTPPEELANRLPVSQADTGGGALASSPTPVEAVPTSPLALEPAAIRPTMPMLPERPIGGLTARGVETAPISRADLSVKNPTIPTGPAAEPLSPADIQSRIGAPSVQTPLAPAGPLGEQMLAREPHPIIQAAARGESWVTPELLVKHYANEDLVNAARQGGDIGAAIDKLETLGAKASSTASHLRAAGVDIPKVPGSPLNKITYADLRQRLGAKGRPDVVPNDVVAANPKQLAIHNANQDVIAAMQSGDMNAVQDAVQTVVDRGGNLDDTVTELRKAGLTDATIAQVKQFARQRLAESGGKRLTLDNFKPKGDTSGTPSVRTPATPAVPPVRGGFLDRLAGFNKDDIGGGRLPFDKPGTQYGTPQEVAAAGSGDLTRADLEAIRAARRDARFGQPAAQAATQASSFDRVPGEAPKVTLNDLARADGTGTETIAQAKQRLAAQAGVDAQTGRPLGQPGQNMPTVSNAGGGKLSLSNIARGAENVTGIGKTLSTAASPFHFMFRHALPTMVAHPQAWLKGSIKGLGEGIGMNPAELAARQAEMKADPVVQQYGTYIGSPHGGIVGGEESIPTNAGNVINRIPVLGKIIERSGQGFVQGLNEVRYMVTKGVDAANPGLTSAQKASMGETINTFTGRGIDTSAAGIGGRFGGGGGEFGQSALRAANVAMFSPQMLASRLKMLGYTTKGMADVLHNVVTGKAPDPVALERARLGIGAMTGMGLLYAIAQAAGGKTDTNPVSTTFGQTDMGPPSVRNGLLSFGASELGMGAQTYAGKNTMFNPTESEATQLRTMARLAVSIYDSATQQKNLNRLEAAPGAKPSTFPETTPGDVGVHWLWSLFSSPLTYPIAQFLEYGGKYPTEPLGPVMPMPLGGALTGAGVQMPTIGGAPAKTPAPGKAPAPARTTAPLLRALQTTKPIAPRVTR